MAQEGGLDRETTPEMTHNETRENGEPRAGLQDIEEDLHRLYLLDHVIITVSLREKTRGGMVAKDTQVLHLEDDQKEMIEVMTEKAGDLQSEISISLPSTHLSVVSHKACLFCSDCTDDDLRWSHKFSDSIIKLDLIKHKTQAD